MLFFLVGIRLCSVVFHFFKPIVCALISFSSWQLFRVCKELYNFVMLKRFFVPISLQEVEKDVKTRTKERLVPGGGGGAAKTLCSPFNQPELPEGRESLFHFSIVI